MPLEPVQPAAPETSPDAGSVDREISRRTRRSFLVGGIATLAGTGAWSWLRTRRPDDDIPWPLRIALRTNELLWRDYFNETRLAQTFAPSDIEAPRLNGNIDLEDDPDSLEPECRGNRGCRRGALPQAGVCGFGSRQTLKAAAVTNNCHPTFHKPRSLVLRIPPVRFIHPNAFSISGRFFRLIW